MHYLYFVALPVKGSDKDDPDTGVADVAEACSEAEQELINNNFASADGGYFSNAKADWFVIGGRWVDFFTERHDWAKQAIAEIELLKEQFKDSKGEKISVIGTHYGDDKTTKKQKELRERAELIWGKHRPKDYPKVRYDRHSGDDGEMIMGVNSIEDCAEVLTPELAKYITDYDTNAQSEWHGGGMEVFVPSEYEEMKVVDFVADENNHGKYYLVIVDYHN